MSNRKGGDVRTPGPTFGRTLSNASAAASVLARHLVRSTDHVSSVPQPWLRSRTYAAAIDALTRGDLTAASGYAAASGPLGRLLRQQISGDLGLLTGPLATTRPSSYREPTGGGVLHLVTNALPEVQAGYTVRTQGIARAQVDDGLPVGVVTRLGFPVTKGHLRAEPEVSVDGVAHHRLLPRRLPLRADHTLERDIEQTGQLVERLRPDVLHAHSNHVNAQVALALRARFGIPVVYEARGFLEETWRSRNSRDTDAEGYQRARTRETACLVAADAVVTLSDAMRAAIVARGVPEERVHVVGNGVAPRFLAAEPLDEGRPFTVGVIGTLNAYEGIDVLIRALADLRDDPVPTRLLVVGDGPARADLEALTAGLGLQDSVAFTGRVPHSAVPGIYRSVDVYAVPRADLPVTRLVPPLKPVEAMGLGRPVIASDLAPLRELIGDERGLLVPPGDHQALATAIARLRDDPCLRRTLGAAGSSWVATHRTWAAAADRYQQIYASTRTSTRTATSTTPSAVTSAVTTGGHR
jgi:glycosyltransferase involved in cell wall biosynthesis